MRGDKATKEISNKEVFDLWMQLGTLPKVASHLNQKGIYNKSTGNPFVSSTIWERAMKWVINNPVESKAIYEKTLQRPITQREWERFLVIRSLRLYDDSIQQLKAWIKKFHMEKHDDIWRKRIPDGRLD